MGTPIALLDLNLDNIKPGVKAYADNDAARFNAFQTWANTYVKGNVVEDELGNKIDLGSNRIVNLDVPSANTDIATIAYINTQLAGQAGSTAVRNKAVCYFKKPNDTAINTTFAQVEDASANTFEVSITTEKANAKILVKCTINYVTDLNWFQPNSLFVKLRKYVSSWSDLVVGNEEDSKVQASAFSSYWTTAGCVTIMYLDETSVAASTTIKYAPWFRKYTSNDTGFYINSYNGSPMSMSSIIVEEIP